MESWISKGHGSNFSLVLKSFLALFLIVLTLYVVIMFLKYVQTYLEVKRKYKGNISIKENISIDNLRKIVHITWEEKEYLIFIGSKNEFILDKSIPDFGGSELITDNEEKAIFSQILNTKNAIVKNDILAENKHSPLNEDEYYRKKILELLEAHAQNGLTKSELTRKTQMLNKEQRELILSNLIKTGQIKIYDQKGKGTKKIVYYKTV